MSNTPRLSKSGIEYLDYAWNFYSGCENWATGICGGGGQKFNCWARSITERFPTHYPNGFNPSFYPEAFLSPLHLRKPSIIGCAFMGDLFGDWVDPGQKIHADLPSGKVSLTTSLKGWIFTTISQCPQHTFLFLTKCPWNLLKWSPFPDNCWVGYTAISQDMLYEGSLYSRDIEAKIKYVSFEPCLDFNLFHPEDLKGANWVIIGAQTKPYKPPKIEWVEEIVRACDKAGVKVFLKDNLVPLLASSPDPKKAESYYSEMGLRQEMPK